LHCLEENPAHGVHRGGRGASGRACRLALKRAAVSLGSWFPSGMSMVAPIVSLKIPLGSSPGSHPSR
jgi:hypothetical protein